MLFLRKRSTFHSPSVSRRDLLSVNSKRMQSTRSHLKSSLSINEPHELFISNMKIKGGHIYKGIVAAEPAEPRLCGCIQPPPIVDDVSPYSAIENISFRN
ncbi:hypothetical protein FRX31_021347 [Thalictrum thalictroides]|uniref:Uncharacterized protein n=1 Tax=Thalictrum thalictroides TaxID=46969 RepID=A0A7J6VVD8_THATH|nr:hypothetical protein FRX31_021347 [Thalictrum thalictroides]